MTVIEVRISPVNVVDMSAGKANVIDHLVFELASFFVVTSGSTVAAAIIFQPIPYSRRSSIVISP